MISNSGHDERGKYHGGQSGDQTGTEWQLREWYNYKGGWTCVLRHPNKAVRDMIGDLAVESANNNHIGYNQDRRGTYWQQLNKVGYRPANIKVNCDSDCSAGVSAIVKATGYLLGVTELQGVSAGNTTNTLRNSLKAVGFEVLTDSKYLTSDKYLLKGDIILKEKHHTCINVTNNTSETVATAPAKPKPTVINNISRVQTELNKYINAGLVVDGNIGKATRKALAKALQTSLNKDYNAGLAVDGIVGNKTVLAYANKISKRGTVSYLTSWIELALITLNYYSGSVEYKGIYGGGVCSGVLQFQKDNGLGADGIAGKNTITKLLNRLSLY